MGLVGWLVTAAVVVFVVATVGWMRYMFVMAVQDYGYASAGELDAGDWWCIVLMGFLLALATVTFPLTLPCYGAYKFITRPIPEPKRGWKEFVEKEDWVTRK